MFLNHTSKFTFLPLKQKVIQKNAFHAGVGTPDGIFT